MSLTFDREGGFTTPNGFHVPAEEVKQVFASLTQLSRRIEDRGFHLPPDDEEITNRAFSEAHFCQADRGTLLRIAKAVERLERNFDSIVFLLKDVLKDFALVLEEPARQVKERKKAEKQERAAARRKRR